MNNRHSHFVVLFVLSMMSYAFAQQAFAKAAPANVELPSIRSVLDYIAASAQVQANSEITF